MPTPLNSFRLLILLGLACDVILLQRFARSRSLRVRAKPWGLRQVALATALILGLMLVVNGVYALIAALTGQDFTALAPIIIPVELVLRIAILGGFISFFKRHQVELGPALGLNAFPPRSAIGWGVVFGLASLPPVELTLAACETFCRYVGFHPSEQPIVELFTATDSRFLLATLVVFALIVAPVTEEFFFRGFAYPALKQRLGTLRAIVIVSASFSATHAHVPSLVALLILGIGLSLAYELTGSLLTSITMHALFNGVMIVRLFHQRGHL